MDHRNEWASRRSSRRREKSAEDKPITKIVHYGMSKSESSHDIIFAKDSPSALFVLILLNGLERRTELVAQTSLEWSGGIEGQLSASALQRRSANGYADCHWTFLKSGDLCLGNTMYAFGSEQCTKAVSFRSRQYFAIRCSLPTLYISRGSMFLNRSI